MVKNSPAMQESNRQQVLFLGGADPLEEATTALQYSCLENLMDRPMDRGAWWVTVHSVAKSWTQLKQFSMHTC